MNPIAKRRLGRTDVHVTQFGFGAAPLGDLFTRVPDEQAMAVQQTAWDAGVRYFDTAPWYGRGQSEHRIGRFLYAKPRDEFVLSTKVGRVLKAPRRAGAFDTGFWTGGLHFDHVFDYSYDGVMRSFDDSQQRLGFPRIDILYVHDIGRVTHADLHEHHWNALTKGGGFRALAELRAADDIRGFGLGVNEWQAIRDALEEADLDCAMLAGRYSLLDRDAARTFLPLAQKAGVAMVLAGVFNSGILAAPPGGRRKFNYADADPRVVAKVEELRAVCDRHGVPLAAAAIQFPIRHPAVACVVIGAKTESQLRQNIAWFDAPLPDDLWAELDALDLMAA